MVSARGYDNSVLTEFLAKKCAKVGVEESNKVVWSSSNNKQLFMTLQGER